MQVIKNFILARTSKTCLFYIILLSRYYRKYKFKMIGFVFKNMFKIYVPSKKHLKGRQIRRLFNKVDIKLNKEDRFVYNIDIFKTVHRDNRVIENISIDYKVILDNSLEDFKKKNESVKSGKYKDTQYEVILGIEEYIDRICKKLANSNLENKDNLILYLNNIKDKKAISFEESIQRILFFNQLLWQVGHGLNGLGRLDKILEESYLYDIKNHNLTKEEAKEMIKDMFCILHQKYWYKSNVLMGDTGQIVILGGKKEDGSYFCNELTYLFIEAIMEVQIPDPKVLLRVSKDVPRNLMELSLKCIKTGIGSPLFSNDDVVIPKLIDFGYEKGDAYEYVTAACWEPLIAGKSIDQNNIDSIVYVDPFLKFLENEDLEKLTNYDKLFNKYKKYLKEYIINFTKEVNEIKWEEAPLLSLVMDGCNKNAKDISLGGAKYNHYGLTSVSLSTVVNSLYNLRKIVYEDKKYTLVELNEYRKNNFVGKEDILRELKKQPIRYGVDDKNIIELTNEVTSYVDKVISMQKNRLGGKFKFGYSAPTYIIKSGTIKATFDGRKDGEPFGVHISSDKSSLAYTELIQFASKLDYTNHRFNGNVIDFMITPSFIENHFDKMTDFLILSISLGFFQMQMNVTSSEILIKAKKDPKSYSNLIVRVWGFSAYFNDLPENYKDLLIERALRNEGKS